MQDYRNAFKHLVLDEKDILNKSVTALCGKTWNPSLVGKDCSDNPMCPDCEYVYAQSFLDKFASIYENEALYFVWVEKYGRISVCIPQDETCCAEAAEVITNHIYFKAALTEI